MSVSPPITRASVTTTFGATVVKDGKGFTTFCPVHESPPEGHTPSLHVEWDAKKRMTLVVCRTEGCSKEQMAQRLGFSTVTEMLSKIDGGHGRSKGLRSRQKRQRFRLVTPTRPLDVDLDAYPLASDSQLTRLAEDRKLPTEAFPPWGIRWDAHTRDYLFPVHTPDGILTDLRRYQIPAKGKKNPVRSWPGGHVGLFGAERLAKSSAVPIYVCAGEWDSIAMRWLLTKLDKPGIVLSLPGEGNFQQKWIEWFRNRTVHTFTDHDNAGRNGELKIADLLTGVATRLTYTHWPEELPEGSDVRDWIIKGALEKQVPQPCYDGLMVMQQPVPRLRPSLPADINHLLVQKVFRQSDAGNAEYLIKQHGANLRYHTEYRAWMQWHENDGSWHTLPKPVLPFGLVIEAMRKRRRDARTEDERKWTAGNESRTRMTDALAIAQSFHGLQVTVNHWNRNPILLAVANGVVDLRTGTLRPHRREDFISFRCPHPYDPKAKCPRWEQFLGEVFPWEKLNEFAPSTNELGEKEQQKQAARFLKWIQRAVGYSLTGLTSEICLFLLYGTGQNGKTTFLNTIAHMLGGPAIASTDQEKPPPTHPGYSHILPFAVLKKMRHESANYELAGLPGRRFVSMAETEKGTHFNDAIIKQLTGGDQVNARGIYAAPMQFIPAAKYWLSVNDLPGTDDRSHAFWSRIRAIPFLRTFKKHRTLQDTLYQEAAGILTWAVHGAVAWHTENGLGLNTVVSRATKAYRAKADPLTDILHVICDRDPDHTALLKHLYAAYVEWARQEGRDRRWTRTKFSALLKEKGYTKVFTAGKKCNEIGFVGLRVKDGFRLKTVKA